MEKNISSLIGEEMKKIFGEDAKTVKIKMLYEKEVRKYVLEIENAHKKASQSNTDIKYGYSLVNP